MFYSIACSCRSFLYLIVWKKEDIQYNKSLNQWFWMKFAPSQADSSSEMRLWITSSQSQLISIMKFSRINPVFPNYVTHQSQDGKPIAPHRTRSCQCPRTSNLRFFLFRSQSHFLITVLLTLQNINLFYILHHWFSRLFSMTQDMAVSAEMLIYFDVNRSKTLVSSLCTPFSLNKVGRLKLPANTYEWILIWMNEGMNECLKPK